MTSGVDKELLDKIFSDLDFESFEEEYEVEEENEDFEELDFDRE